MPFQTKINRRAIGFFILLLVGLSVIHVGIYLNGEHHIYVNDFRNYWIAYWKSGIQFQSDFAGWVSTLRGEIWASDYNSLPAALLLPFSLSMGYSRYGYILGATLTYLIPVVLLSAKAATLVVRDESDGARAFLPFLIIAACFVPYWVPTLAGWVDIVGLIPFALAFIVVRTAGLGKKIRPGVAITLGILIWMPFLFRRWYAFAIVAFVFTAPVYCIVLARIQSRSDWQKSIINTAINFALAGLSAVIVCLVLQGALVKTILQTSYSSIYVAYQRPLMGHFIDLWQHFGGLYLVLAVSGAGFLFKTASKRADAVFVIVNAVLLFFLFTRTQGFGAHHYLPLAFWIYMLICMGVWSVFSIPSVRPERAIFIFSIVSLAVLIFSFYRIKPGELLAGSILPRSSYNNQMGNEAAYRRLAFQLDELVKQDEKFTVFASNVLLNRDLLLSVSDEALAGRDADTSHVDLIQGLSVAPFLARYAVVSDPVLTHLPAGTQSVITIPAKAILEGRGIGAAYKRIGASYPINGDVKAFVYEKTRPFTRAEVDEMLGDFFKIYPEWRAVYANEMFKLAMTATTEIGDRWGKFDYSPDGTISVHTGETKPTIASFNGVSQELSLSVAPACPGSDGVDVLLRSSGREVSRLTVEPGQSAKLLTTDPTASYELVISKRANAWCDLVTIAPLR